MDELDLFRDFRSGVTEPSADAERRASVRLAQAIERRQDRRSRVLRVVRHRPRGTALGAAVLAGTVAAALFVTAPWSNTPGFLERAQATLTPPAGSILHAKWVDRVTSRELGCTATFGPIEVWIDQTPPQRYRAVAPPFDVGPPARTARDLVCGNSGGQTEFGGQTQPAGRGLVFVPPKTLRRTIWAPPYFTADPVGNLRLAINDGRAHDEGKTELDGRTVERIRIDPPPRGCPVSFCGPRERRPSYTYVDPETFALVQEDGRGLIFGSPQVPLKQPLHIDVVTRYLTFEYLPRTEANLALTNIRAQHPDATVQCTPTWVERC